MAAKGKASKAGDPMIISKSRVKAAVKKCNVGGEFYGALEAEVYLIGFTPSPARDVLQSAALFSGRLTWFDHHEWPPEDLEAVRQITGDENLHVTPGAGTSLPAVLEQSTRRSRFSDKLVDLATARFTQHDFERWTLFPWVTIACPPAPIDSHEVMLFGRYKPARHKVRLYVRPQNLTLTAPDRYWLIERKQASPIDSACHTLPKASADRSWKQLYSKVAMR